MQNLLNKTLCKKTLQLLIELSFAGLSLAQAPLPAGISPQMGAALQGALGGAGGPDGLGASLGVGIGNMNGGVGALGNTAIQGADSVLPSSTKVPVPVFRPLLPNAFQQFVLQVTGQSYPLYGASFFENIRLFDASIQESAGSGSLNGFTNFNNPFAPEVNAPVTPDYVLGPGDQLLIKAWGSLEINYKAVIDRNGQIFIPKIGVISLSGVKMGDAQGVINQTLSGLYKNYNLSVSLGQTRAITVYVVGQARRPGSYSLSSLSTISTALFASGGPNANGSMRRVQLKRAGAVVAEFDLYQFLSIGQANGDVKLLDGDVIVMPAALGFVALVGKLNTPSIYELKHQEETLEQLLAVAGGLSITTDPRQATLERLDASQDQPRWVSNLDLNKFGLQVKLKSGDLINFYTISPELKNSVTLRGNVTLPKRLAYREGMRVRDLIPNREALISADSVRRQNEVLFDNNERERTQRARESIPNDLLSNLNGSNANSLESGSSSLNKSSLDASKISEAQKSMFGNLSGAGNAGVNSFDQNTDEKLTFNQWQQLRQDRLLAEQPKISDIRRHALTDRVGQLFDQVNFDYAVVERVNRKDLSVSLIPFNLGVAIDNENSPENITLEQGDIVTVFSIDDIRVPVSKRRILVKLEGEVAKPGIYQATPSDTLQTLLKRAGGVTNDAYLFGAGFYREDVKQSQLQNLEKLLRRLESESNASLSQLAQSSGASTNAGIIQAKVLAAQQIQRDAIMRLRNLKPEGRISLGLASVIQSSMDELPALHLQNNDRFFVPPKPDFVYVFGSVNTESALIYKSRWTVQDYLNSSGMGTGADKEAIILIRADGSALTGNSSWRNQVLSAAVLPGDTIVVPDKLDRESFWSSFFRNTLDGTQIFYQLGLGAAAIKTLRN